MQVTFLLHQWFIFSRTKLTFKSQFYETWHYSSVKFAQAMKHYTRPTHFVPCSCTHKCQSFILICLDLLVVIVIFDILKSSTSYFIFYIILRLELFQVALCRSWLKTIPHSSSKLHVYSKNCLRLTLGEKKRINNSWKPNILTPSSPILSQRTTSRTKKPENSTENATGRFSGRVDGERVPSRNETDSSYLDTFLHQPL